MSEKLSLILTDSYPFGYKDWVPILDYLVEVGLKISDGLGIVTWFESVTF